MPVGISALLSGASILFIVVLTSSVLCAFINKLKKHKINVKAMLTWGGDFFILLHNINFFMIYNFTSKRPFVIRIVSP
jgi:DMSO/TMAO reductase YedYZ heme-binding membrane subunit